MTKNEVKAKVRERDKKCVDCGATRGIGKVPRLQVHRLVPGSEYSLEGCVALCVTCHATRHRKPQPKRERIVWVIPTPTTPKVIVELRERLGLTAKEFGDRLGVTMNTVFRWESGERFPSRRHQSELNKMSEEVSSKMQVA